MVAIFFTFALSGPLPPKEMGIILGVAVLLDAFLIRLVLIPVALRLLGSCSLGAAELARPGAAGRAVRPPLAAGEIVLPGLREGQSGAIMTQAPPRSPTFSKPCRS